MVRSAALRRLLVTACTLGVIASAGWAGGWFVPTEAKVTELAPGVFFRKAQTEPVLPAATRVG